MCQTNTQYITITPITSVKQAQTTPQTRLADASTQHTSKLIQTPIVEVTTEHAQEVTQLQAQTETKTHTMPELQTNTAYIQKHTELGTQTISPNLVQHSVSFFVPSFSTCDVVLQTDVVPTELPVHSLGVQCSSFGLVGNFGCQYEFLPCPSPLLDVGLSFAVPDLARTDDFETSVFRSRNRLQTTVYRRSYSETRPPISRDRSHSISHTHTSWDTVPPVPLSRDVGIHVAPDAIQRADVGLNVYLFPGPEEEFEHDKLSAREHYNLQYKFGRIAESQVSVFPSTSSAQTQTDAQPSWEEVEQQEVEPDQKQQPSRSARTQTDLLDWDMSESTTKLCRPSIYEIRVDSTEEITQSIQYESRLISESFSSDHSPQEYSEYQHVIRCRVRQRTAQYELLEVRREGHVSWYDSIKEVASPITGLFAPVGTAIRAGWLDLSEQSRYINPTNGLSIPLEAAVARGLVRLNESDTDSDPCNPMNMPSLLLIERISFSWRPVRIVSFLDTESGIQYSIEDALERGFIEISTGEPIILDRATSTWISTEEAALRGVIQIELIDEDESDSSSLVEETYSCRVFRIIAVRPGGEPSDWLDPLEAARIGLFNWQTGEVAAEWQTTSDSTTITEVRDEEAQKLTHCVRHSTNRFVPTRWCSLLTARRARWLRLHAELHPMEWVSAISSDSHSQTGHRILATHVHLFAPSTIPINPLAPTADYTLSSQTYSESASESYSVAADSMSIEMAAPMPMYPQRGRHETLLSLSPSPPIPQLVVNLESPPSPPAFAPGTQLLSEQRYSSTSTHTVTQMEQQTDWRQHRETVNRPVDIQRRLLSPYTASRAQSDAILQESTSSAQYSSSSYALAEANEPGPYAQQPRRRYQNRHRMYMSEQYLERTEEQEQLYEPSVFQPWAEDSDSFA